ncbi:SRPBCC family protein [Micromonospora sp. NPDC049523]|uniref:SRPBCC family protein n=1 Tax=Micromonospora sp. NPDC049523 TaxID=3155921 RepID=UPI003431017A
MTFRISLDISRPLPEVFAFLADFRNMPRWYEAVEQATASADGSHFHLVRSLPGGRAHNDVEMTSFRQDEEVTFASINGPTPFRYRYRFEPLPGGTRLTLEGSISGQGLPGLAGHLGPLAEKLFSQGMRKNLLELQRILEAAPERGRRSY